jgi:hypothetical protein
MSFAEIPVAAYYVLGYIFLLIGALVVVNLVLSRLTREERQAARRQRQPAHERDRNHQS